jgi:uncharacterized membrane protein YgcG
MGRGVVVGLLALLGLLCAAGMGYAAYLVSRDSVAVPVTRLQPKPQQLTPARVRAKPARSGATTRAATTRATTTRTATTSATTTVDDHGGRGGGDDNSGRGGGSGSSGGSGGGGGHGGDD